MSKINYPDGGLLNLIKGTLDGADKNLSFARNSLVYNIPSNFSHLQGLRALANDMADMSRRLSDIYSTAQSTDNSFKVIRETMDANNKSLDLSVIEEKGRLVK